jgi:hypothetical protein
MSKYSGPYDVNYKCVLNILKVFCNFASTQQLWKAIASCDDSAVRTLLEIGADPDLKNLAGRSALHLAAEAKSKSITKLLLDEARIIDVNSKDIEDKTALDYAVSNGSEGIVGLLLGRGAETPDLQAGDTTDETTTDSLKALLNKPALLSGPTLNRNPSLLQKSGDHLSPACRRACKDFEVTKTTFYLIKEHNKSSDKTAGKNPVHNANNDTKPNMGADKNTEKRPDKTKDSDFEKIKKGVNKPSKSYNWIAETEPKEWRLSQTSTIYETLYPETEGPELPPESVTSQYNKPAPSVTWKWYHFPANNVCSRFQQRSKEYY